MPDRTRASLLLAVAAAAAARCAPAVPLELTSVLGSNRAALGSARAREYQRDLVLDQPRAYWPLPGPVAGPLLSDPAGATTLRAEQAVVLRPPAGAPAGDEVAVELWLKDPRGAVLALDAGGAPALMVSVADAARAELTVTAGAAPMATGVRVPPGVWSHLGLGWNRRTGALSLSRDGMRRWSGTSAPDGASGGDTLRLGGAAGAAGAVAHVALFDRAPAPGRWLHHVQVARGLADAPPAEQRLPPLPPQGGEPLRLTSAVAFSPDERLLAVACAGGAILVFATETWQLLRSWKAHDDWYVRLAFSPDGERMASAGDDGKVRVWNRRDGKLAREWAFTVPGKPRDEWRRESQEANELRGVAFSPDGTRLAVTHGRGRLRVWEVHTGALLRDADIGLEAGRPTFTPDGGSVVAMLSDGGVIVNVQSGERFPFGERKLVEGMVASELAWIGADALITGTWTRAPAGDGVRGGFRVDYWRRDAAGVVMRARSEPLDQQGFVSAVPAYAELYGSPPVFAVGGAVLTLRRAPDGDVTATVETTSVGSLQTRLGAGDIFATALVRVDNSQLRVRARNRSAPPSDAGAATAPLLDFRPATGVPEQLEVSPSGRWLALGNRFAALEVWDVSTGKQTLVPAR